MWPKYSTDANQVICSDTDYFIKYLDRKTLVLEIRYIQENKNDEKIIQTCRVLTGFEEVIKQQDNSFKADEEVKRIIEEKERKAREGNKI